jgi:hypothetical protein
MEKKSAVLLILTDRHKFSLRQTSRIEAKEGVDTGNHGKSSLLKAEKALHVANGCAQENKSAITWPEVGMCVMGYNSQEKVIFWIPNHSAVLLVKTR